MLSIDHSPLDDRIYFKEARSLQKNGFEVSMVFASDKDGIAYNMGGKKTINKPNESILDLEGITCHLVKRPDNFIQNLLGKAFVGEFYSNFINKAVELNAAVYHAHEPVTYYLGLKIAKRTGAKLIFDSHESWTGGTKKDKFIKLFYAKKLTHLISANEITRGSLLIKNRYIKPEVIYNYPVPEIFSGKFEESKFENPIIVHDGYLPFNRGLKEMIEVISILKKDFPKIKFRILGETFGEEKKYLIEKINSLGLQDNIEETGWVDYENVGKHLEDCSIGLILKTDTPNNVLGGPAIKLFNYFAYGIAVIDSNLHESTRFLNEINAGITVKNRNPQTIAKAIRVYLQAPSLLKDHCLKSYKAYQAYNWLSEEKKLVNYYNNEVLSKNDIFVR